MLTEERQRRQDEEVGLHEERTLERTGFRYLSAAPASPAPVGRFSPGRFQDNSEWLRERDEARKAENEKLRLSPEASAELAARCLKKTINTKLSPVFAIGE